MNVPDEKLMAYADGELDAQERAEIEAAIAANPELAQRVEQHKSLRTRLGAAFDGVLREPVPDRLLNAVKSPAERARPASVTSLATARAARAERSAGTQSRRWSWPEWGAIAASLVIGAVVGRAMLSGPMTVSEGRLVARSELSQALSTQLSGDAEPDAAVQIGVSFRDSSGDYCRTFVIRDERSLAGFACRENEGWNVEVLARSEAAPGGGYRPAGAALPAAVQQAVDTRIAGEPLDADDEAQARAKDWRN